MKIGYLYKNKINKLIVMCTKVESTAEKFTGIILKNPLEVSQCIIGNMWECISDNYEEYIGQLDLNNKYIKTTNKLSKDYILGYEEGFKNGVASEREL